MDAAFIAPYDSPMSNKKRGTRAKPAPPAVVRSVAEEEQLGTYLGRALRALRKRLADTQDAFAEMTGRSQSSQSDAENNKVGWDTVNEWGAAVSRAGGDPLDLLRLAVGYAEPDPELSELITLWHQAKPEIRSAVLTLLRAQVPGSAETR